MKAPLATRWLLLYVLMRGGSGTFWYRAISLITP